MLYKNCYNDRIYFIYPPPCLIICFHLHRNFIIPSSKRPPSCLRTTRPVTFHKPLLRPALHHEGRSPWTKTGDNHLVLSRGFTVCAIKPTIQAPVASDESTRKCVVWRCPRGTLHPSYRPMMDTCGN